VSHANPAHYEPSNITFGILQPLSGAPRGKKQRNLALSERALADLVDWMSSRGLLEAVGADPRVGPGADTQVRPYRQ
jgi:methylenetetrahydrofolate--tRNA-(uracil-5-)-methyltransferase